MASISIKRFLSNKDNRESLTSIRFWYYVIILSFLTCIYYVCSKVKSGLIVFNYLQRKYYPGAAATFKPITNSKPIRWQAALLKNYKMYTYKTITRAWYDGLFRAY